MSDLIERSILLINGYVSQWTKKYLYQTSYCEETATGHTFMTEFSLPTAIKPIPSATVHVYFYVPDLTDPQERTLSFRFENDQLIHLVSRTIRVTQMERWIETILQRKDRTCRIMFLGTQFEQTRIVNSRMDEVLKEKRVEIEKEALVLHPSLLEKDDELINQFTVPEEDSQRELKMLKELLYQVFRQVDTQDLGVISHEECAKVFTLMGLSLGKHQLEDTLNKLDVTNTGIIHFDELSTLGIEIIHAIYTHNQAIRELTLREEESRFEAQWMLADDLSALNKAVIHECKKIDEEESLTILPDQLKAILDDQTTLLKQEEIQKILDYIGVKPFPYLTFESVLKATIFQSLVDGLLAESKSKLEQYLIDLFSKMDPTNTGNIKINEVMISLKNNDKIKISKAQVFALQSYIRQDDQHNVAYKIEARRLASVLKKFFNTDQISQKNILIADPKVTQYIPIIQQEEVQKIVQLIGTN